MNRLNSKSNRAKRFQVKINYHEAHKPNGSREEIKQLTTQELYNLITHFNNSKEIASISLVKTL